MKSKLQWRHDADSVFAEGGYHRLLPAFFKTMFELERQGRDFAIVIRTFGTDLPEVTECIQAFAQGGHPDFPGVRFERFMLNRTFGSKEIPPDQDARWAVCRLDRSDMQSPIVMRRYDKDTFGECFPKSLTQPQLENHAEELSELQAVELMESRATVGVRDDYRYWSGHGYRPDVGKPVWVSLDDEHTHHIFFDDNVHYLDNDSVVAVRARASSESDFSTAPPEATRLLEGVLVVKAQPYDAINDPDYFLKQIERCERNFEEFRTSGKLNAILFPDSVSSRLEDKTRIDSI